MQFKWSEWWWGVKLQNVFSNIWLPAWWEKLQSQIESKRSATLSSHPCFKFSRAQWARPPSIPRPPHPPPPTSTLSPPQAISEQNKTGWRFKEGYGASHKPPLISKSAKHLVSAPCGAATSLGLAPRRPGQSIEEDGEQGAHADGESVWALESGFYISLLSSEKQHIWGETHTFWGKQQS